MCARNPDCQLCETCGRRKYQFWVGPEMHERGCPFGAPAADQCQETRQHAGMLQWMVENGVEVKERGMALLLQMERLGAVDRTDQPSQSNGTMQ